MDVSRFLVSLAQTLSTMSLYKRLHEVQPTPAAGPGHRDPVLDELRQKIHHHLIDELDLSAFRARFKNDEPGAPAYDPAVLLKVVMLGYSRGIVS